jgi:O-antigen ligase
MILGAHFLIETRNTIARFGWVIQMTICGYAVAMTRSRGGFLALLAGVAVFFGARLHWKKALPLLVLAMPLMFFLFAGRQTDIDVGNPEDTAQGRILIWRDGFMLFKGAPICGIGYDTMEEVEGIVAHNSFVHGFVELGICGGIVFVGLFYLCAKSLRRINSGTVEVSPMLRKWAPTLLSIFAACATGLFSLTRNYALSTYFIIGLIAAYCSIAGQEAGSDVLTSNRALAGRVVLVGVLTLLGLMVFVRVVAV